LALAQKLVKQIAKARSTLTDPRLRAHYNQQLQRMAPTQAVSVHGGLDLTSSVAGTRATRRPGRKKVSNPYRFPLFLSLFVCVIGAALVLALRLPGMMNQRSDRSLIDGGRSIGLTGIMGTTATPDHNSEVAADGTSMPSSKADGEEGERPVGEMPPPAVVAVSAEGAGAAGVAVKPNEPRVPLPETTGKDPLRDDLDADNFADDVFSGNGVEAAEHPLMKDETAADGTPSNLSAGDSQSGERESSQITGQQEESHPRTLTFEEEQARHGQRSPRRQAANDGER
jgi:hypothetical protein